MGIEVGRSGIERKVPVFKANSNHSRRDNQSPSREKKKENNVNSGIQKNKVDVRETTKEEFKGHIFDRYV